MDSNLPALTSTPTAMAAIEATKGFCTSCKRGISALTVDTHKVCIECRGLECDLNNRCIECKEWSIQDMENNLRELTNWKHHSKKTNIEGSIMCTDPSIASSSPSSPNIEQKQLLNTNWTKEVETKINQSMSEMLTMVRSELDSFKTSFTKSTDFTKINETSLQVPDLRSGIAVLVGADDFSEDFNNIKRRSNIGSDVVLESNKDPVSYSQVSTNPSVDLNRITDNCQVGDSSGINVGMLVNEQRSQEQKVTNTNYADQITPATYTPSSLIFDPILSHRNPILSIPESLTVKPNPIPSTFPNPSLSQSHDYKKERIPTADAVKLAEYNAGVLGLSTKYKQLANYFFTHRFTGHHVFKEFVTNKWPELGQDLHLDFHGDYSIYLNSLGVKKQSPSIPPIPSPPVRQIPCGDSQTTMPVSHIPDFDARNIRPVSHIHEIDTRNTRPVSHTKDVEVGNINPVSHIHNFNIEITRPVSQIRNFPTSLPLPTFVQAPVRSSGTTGFGSVFDRIAPIPSTSSVFDRLERGTGDPFNFSSGWTKPNLTPPVTPFETFNPRNAFDSHGYQPYSQEFPGMEQPQEDITDSDEDEYYLEDDNSDEESFKRRDARPKEWDPRLAPNNIREYRRMLNFITNVFPEALGERPGLKDPRGLMERRFMLSRDGKGPLPTLNWYDRVQYAHAHADQHLYTHLAAKKPDFYLISKAKRIYSVPGNPSKGKFIKLNDSLFHFFEKKSIGLSKEVGITLREVQLMETLFRNQSEALSHSLWVLTSMMEYIKREGFIPSDQPLMDQMVKSSSLGLAYQANVASSMTTFLCTKRRKFYLKNLPKYFDENLKRNMLYSSTCLTSKLFDEQAISKLLETSHTTSTLKSHQSLVDLVRNVTRTRNVSRSPYRTPYRGKIPYRATYYKGSDRSPRRSLSRSPSRSPKRVKFASAKPTPPPEKQNFSR